MCLPHWRGGGIQMNTFLDTPEKRFTAWGEFSTCFT